MGNQPNVPQARRHQDDPIICCGDEPRRQPLEQASPNVMNVNKQTYGKFSRSGSNSQKNDQNLQFEQTGSTYYKQKDVTIFRKPGNNLENSTYQNARNSQNENQTKDSKQFNPLRPITQQSEIKKSGYASFQKSTYGGFNANKSGYNTFNSYGLHTTNKDTKENIQLNLDPRNHRPTPMVDFVGQKDIKHEIKKEAVKNNGPFVGQGKYGGRIEEFENNKRIVMFLSQNHLKQAEFKFYDIKDNSSLLNNSTIMHAKKKYGKIDQKYLDQNSTSNLRVNQNLSKLQEPIELTLQVDARIILATCLLIIGIVILALGATVFESDVNQFICLMIAIILYVFYVLICYIYNDIIEYLANARSFDRFQEDYKRLRQASGELAYHIHLQTPKKTIKQCYLLAQENKFTKIQYLENQNKDITVNELKDKRVSFLFIRYKTKTSFIDAQSQMNAINYFDDFLQKQKQIVDSHYGSIPQSKKQSKKSVIKQVSGRSKVGKQSNMNSTQKNFKQSLKKSDFGYELNAMEGMSRKPEQVFNVCYMDDEDNGCFITLFVIFTLLGLCLPFLCIFQAYAKRYRINLLNRFKVGQGRI